MRRIIFLSLIMNNSFIAKLFAASQAGGAEITHSEDKKTEETPPLSEEDEFLNTIDQFLIRLCKNKTIYVNNNRYTLSVVGWDNTDIVYQLERRSHAHFLGSFKKVKVKAELRVVDHEKYPVIVLRDQRMRYDLAINPLTNIAHAIKRECRSIKDFNEIIHATFRIHQSLLEDTCGKSDSPSCPYLAALKGSPSVNAIDLKDFFQAKGSGSVAPTPLHFLVSGSYQTHPVFIPESVSQLENPRLGRKSSCQDLLEALKLQRESIVKSLRELREEDPKPTV